MTWEKLITVEGSFTICLEFSLRKASRAHVSNHNIDGPELFMASFAPRLIGVMPIELRCSITLLVIEGEIIETLYPLAVNSLAKYMAGRIEPSKSSIMSQAKVKSIYQISSNHYKLDLCFNITFDEADRNMLGRTRLARASA